jgi:predicted Zn-dependent protease
LDEAREQASVVASQVSARRGAARRVTEEEYGQWAIAAELRSDEQLLENVAVAWLRDYPESGDPRRLMASFRQRQFDELVGSASASATEVARLMVEATELGAPSEWLGRSVQRLLDPQQATQVPARAAKELVRSEETPTVLLEALGAQLAIAGQYDEAAVAFGEIVKRSDSTPAAHNNRAYVLMKAAASAVERGEALPTKTIDEALASVKLALDADPDSFSFRETRGQVRALAGDWQGAVDDLEYALNGLPEVKEVHRTLATAYEALGQKDLASAHRAAAQ